MEFFAIGTEGPSRNMSADGHACDGVPEPGIRNCDEELAVWTKNHRRKRSFKSLRHTHDKRTSLHDGSAWLITFQVPQSEFDWFPFKLSIRVFLGRLIAQEDSEVRTEK